MPAPEFDWDQPTIHRLALDDETVAAMLEECERLRVTPLDLLSRIVRVVFQNMCEAREELDAEVLGLSPSASSSLN